MHFKENQENRQVIGTEDILLRLCNSVVDVLTVATQSNLHYSGMVQRITKTCLKPDIGCFVLFDGGFTGLVVINFSAAAAMELYETYLTAWVWRNRNWLPATPRMKWVMSWGS